MPVCFQLIRNGDNEPTPLNAIDVELCTLLNVPVDDVKYVNGWYDYIGLRLALGQTFAEIEASIVESHDAQETPEWRNHFERMLKINAYLAKNFSTESWREVGRHG